MLSMNRVDYNRLILHGISDLLETPRVSSATPRLRVKIASLEDERVYADYAHEFKQDFPSTAAVLKTPRVSSATPRLRVEIDSHLWPHLISATPLKFPPPMKDDVSRRRHPALNTQLTACKTHQWH
jgi:hypothetical protein